MPTTIMSNYSYGEDCFQDLPQVLSQYQVKTIALVGGQQALASCADEVAAILTQHGYEVTGHFVYGQDATQTTIDRLVATSGIAQADMIFGFGGGRALDAVKMVAHALKKPMFAFPTICSTCAAGTAITVLYKDDHSFSHYGYPDAPLHIFINTRVLAQAPDKYFWAGIADGISKAPEVDRASRYAQEQGLVLPHTAVLGRSIALSSKEAFYRYGAQALADVAANRTSPAVDEIALSILVSTAYASNLVNQPDFYYNSAHAHAFYNGTTAVKREGEYLHGAVVAFGVMVLHAYYGEMAELETVARFNKSLGFPVTLAEMGLTAADVETIVAVALTTNEYQHTPFDGPAFHQAILTADQFGQSLSQ